MKLSTDYDAVIDNNEIVVGCQHISFKVFDELALLVKKYAIGAVQLSPLRAKAADVNASNSVNATTKDAIIRLKQHLLHG